MLVSAPVYFWLLPAHSLCPWYYSLVVGKGSLCWFHQHSTWKMCISYHLTVANTQTSHFWATLASPSENQWLQLVSALLSLTFVHLHLQAIYTIEMFTDSRSIMLLTLYTWPVGSGCCRKRPTPYWDVTERPRHSTSPVYTKRDPTFFKYHYSCFSPAHCLKPREPRIWVRAKPLALRPHSWKLPNSKAEGRSEQ